MIISMINIIANFMVEHSIFTLLLVVLSSFLTRYLLITINQKWIQTSSHTYTLFLLPIITFFITKAISGNLALSIGMVGALSIVRFRHPVRSPLELSIYFYSIAAGIAASVNVSIFLSLYFALFFTSIIIYFYNLFSVKYLKKKFFITSFSEGNILSNLEVITIKEIDEIENSIHLKQKIKTKENLKYNLSSANFEDLLKIEKIIKEKNEILSYQLNN